MEKHLEWFLENHLIGVFKKKHFKNFEIFQKCPQVIPDIFLPFHSYLSPSFSSSIALHQRLHNRKDAPLSFDIVDRIEGNPLFFCYFSFPFF